MILTPLNLQMVYPLGRVLALHPGSWGQLLERLHLIWRNGNLDDATIIWLPWPWCFKWWFAPCCRICHSFWQMISWMLLLISEIFTQCKKTLICKNWNNGLICALTFQQVNYQTLYQNALVDSVRISQGFRFRSDESQPMGGNKI